MAFGVASIDAEIVVSYAAALALLLALGALFILGFYFLVANRVFTDHQVEQLLFIRGWNTGTVAMGTALLPVIVMAGFAWPAALVLVLVAVGIFLALLAKFTFARQSLPQKTSATP